jgi:hypothetical protein
VSPKFFGKFEKGILHFKTKNTVKINKCPDMSGF